MAACSAGRTRVAVALAPAPAAAASTNPAGVLPGCKSSSCRGQSRTDDQAVEPPSYGSKGSYVGSCDGGDAASKLGLRSACPLPANTEQPCQCRSRTFSSCAALEKQA